uniref:InaF motif containing 2 n=1 Tax=Timema monikensis TaxID=170555 RepID=A0A7R9EJM9_9NEOP|nr:unnamed protein product [Timema monikensis]
MPDGCVNSDAEFLDVYTTSQSSYKGVSPVRSINATHHPERLWGSATPTGVAVRRVSTRTLDSTMSEHSDDDASLGDDGHQAPSGAKYAEDAAKDKLYEPKKARKIIRVLTVVAYVFSVSLAAIMLSLYYVFLWDPKMPTTGRQVAGHDPEPQPCIQHVLLDTQTEGIEKQRTRMNNSIPVEERVAVALRSPSVATLIRINVIHYCVLVAASWSRRPGRKPGRGLGVVKLDALSKKDQLQNTFTC